MKLIISIALIFTCYLLFSTFLNCNSDDSSTSPETTSSSSQTSYSFTTTSWTGIVTEFQVNSYTSGNQHNPVVASDPSGNFVIAWVSDGQINNEDIFMQLYNVNGTKIGTEKLVSDYTDNTQTNPAIKMFSNGDFIVTWHGKGLGDNPTLTNDFGVFAKKFNSSGSTLVSEFLVNTFIDFQQINPDIAISDNGNFIIVWQSIGQVNGNSFEVFGQIFDSSCHKLGGEFMINEYTDYNQINPKVICKADGRFVVTWMSELQDENDFEIFGREYSASGLPYSSEFRANQKITGDQKSPSICISPSSDIFYITWFGTSASHTSDGIFGRYFQLNGMKYTFDFNINIVNSGSLSNPTIDINSDGNLLIVWAYNDYIDYSTNIIAKKISSTISDLSSTFKVNTFLPFIQTNPKVSFLKSTNKYVAVWQSDSQDSSGLGIYANILDY